MFILVCSQLVDLPAFTPCQSGLTGLRHQLLCQSLDASLVASQTTEQLHMLAVPDTPTYITPALAPPSQQEVQQWLDQKRAGKVAEQANINSAQDTDVNSASSHKTDPTSDVFALNESNNSFKSTDSDFFHKLKSLDKTLQKDVALEKTSVARKLDFDKTSVEQSDWTSLESDDGNSLTDTVIASPDQTRDSLPESSTRLKTELKVSKPLQSEGSTGVTVSLSHLVICHRGQRWYRERRSEETVTS